MKHILFICLSVCLFVVLSPQIKAQRINAYFASGATASQIEGDELKGFDKWGFTGSVGAMVSISNNDRFYLSAEAGYARRGAYNNSGDPYNVKIILDYVDIPLTFFYHDPWGGMYFGAGIVYSRLVQQPHGELKFNPSYFVPDTADMAFLKNDLAFALEMRFKIWRGLHFSLRYQYSIIPVKRNWHFIEYRQSRNNLYWDNNCFNSSAMARLIWQFGTEVEKRHTHHGTK